MKKSIMTACCVLTITGILLAETDPGKIIPPGSMNSNTVIQKNMALNKSISGYHVSGIRSLHKKSAQTGCVL